MLALKFNPFIHFIKISLCGILVLNGIVAKGQGWDWENHYTWKSDHLSIGVSPSIDSHGNFYTIGGVNEKRAVLKNSFGFEDTFYQSKQGKYGHILTKFNRRGKKIWQTDFPVLLENESFILGV